MIGNSINLPELPDNWVRTHLGEISELIRGVSYPKAESSNEPKDKHVPILRATNIDLKLNFDDLIHVPIGRLKDKQFIRASDVLIAMSSGSKALVGKAAQAKHDFDGGFGAFCGLARAFSGLDHWFFGLFFQSPVYRNEVSRLSMGVNINNLRRGHIESMPFPLPPLSEQHRIVAKIDELFTRLNAGVGVLEKIKAQSKRYRQAILKHAFEGKLTQEWRMAHKGELEPASVLLERIREERSKVHGKLKDTLPVDLSDLPELPEGWVWARLGEITENHDGKRIPVKESEREKMRGEFPYYGASGIIDYVNRYLFEGEYLLISEDGANLLARSTPIAFIAIGKFWVNNHAHVITTYSETPLQYLENYFNGLDLSKWVTGTAQPKITQANMNCIPVPVAPLAEQCKIVEEIERYFSVIDKVQKVVDRGLRQATRLRQSILKKAFEGKLVPQDTIDEPAEKLLERIREDREKQKANEKAGKRKNNRQLRMV